MTQANDQSADQNEATETAEEYPLSKLMLDGNNPRFAGIRDQDASQVDILDYIVKTFGVDDVLSSLAVNGYFKAEPVVGKAEDGSIVIREGNRRLAACLIITGDERAKNQAIRTSHFSKIWKEHGANKIDPIPVLVFDDNKDKRSLLSYLGVRHISAPQPWDSFAKAVWVSEVLNESTLSLRDVSLMIGDQHNTVHRLTEGYYFVDQAIKTGFFRPQDSVRKGRGSNTDYPFSWVYTLLGYSSVRRFVNLPEDAAIADPIPQDKLENAGVLLHSMFGDKSNGRNSAVEDSRDLGKLATIFSDPNKIELLSAGKSVREIMRVSRPIDRRIRESLTEIRTLENEAIQGLTESFLPQDVAETLIEPAGIVRRLANEIERKIQRFAEGDNE